MVQIAINGFGRIGRTAGRILLDRFADKAKLVAVNDLTDNETLAHLWRYDSNYGIWSKEVEFDDDYLIVGGNKIRSLAEKDPVKLPWAELEVDVVLECTGRFTDPKESASHLKAGARRVIISAPAKGEGATTHIISVNEDSAHKSEVISNASCTTNSVTPVAAVIEREFGIIKAAMTTIHSYTADQNLHDAPHKDLRRARAAAENIVPTTTGAAISTAEVIPSLKGIFDGLAIRVPTPVGSLSDFTFLTKKKVSVADVNQAFRAAAEQPRFKGILEVTEQPIVSRDIVGSSASAIVDLSLTNVIDGDLVKVIAWYDNEYGYSCRLVEMALLVGK